VGGSQQGCVTYEQSCFEESVLWDLSARLMGVLDDVQLVSPPGGGPAPGALTDEFSVRV
jgi:hypothetical protein